MTSEKTLSLAHNCSLAISEDRTQLTLSSSSNGPMTIRLTDSGPVLEMDAPQMVIRNTGGLTLEAEALHFVSRGDLVQEVGGDLRQRVSGNLETVVRDDAHLSAQATHIEAHQGELSLRASDDVALNGLRILHNVPTENELQDAYGKAKTFGQKMQCPVVDPNGPRRLPKTPPRPRGDW